MLSHFAPPRRLASPRLHAALALALAAALGLGCSSGTGGGTAAASTTSSSTTSGGGATTGGTATGGANGAASLAITMSPAAQSGAEVAIDFVLTHPASPAVAIEAHYSTDGGVSWFPATAAPSGAGTAGLTSSPGGAAHTFTWAANDDLCGTVQPAARVRLTPVGPAVGAPAETGDFAYDGSQLPHGPATLIRYPYVQRVDQTSAVIAWQSTPTGPGEVHYGLTPALGQVALATAGPGYQYEAELTGLMPGAAVYYRVASHQHPLTPGESFRTAPDASTSGFRFLVVGDSGKGGRDQWGVARRMATEPTDFVIHTGDVIYPYGSHSDYQAKFFDPYRDIARRAPFFMSIGNHDILTLFGDPYDDAFALPRNNPSATERYYSFDWGNARFISIDTSIGFMLPGGAQYQWLAAELRRPRPDWLFAFFHFPLYSAGDHGSTSWLRYVIEPLFETAGVDVVFSGHDHNYERTLPRTSAQTVHFVTGGGGAGLRPVGHESFTAVAESVHHYMRVEIQGRTFTATAIRADGTTLDTCTITK